MVLIQINLINPITHHFVIIIEYKYFNIDWAALNGRAEIVELMLEHKADPNIKNEFDRIPFEEALQNGFEHVAVIIFCIYMLLGNLS